MCLNQLADERLGRFGRFLPTQLPRQVPKPRGIATDDLHGHLGSTALGAATSKSCEKRGSGIAMIAVRRRQLAARNSKPRSGSPVAGPSGAFASSITVITGDRALKIEKKLAELLHVELEELRDFLVDDIRTSSTRRTGFRFVRGTHGSHYVRDGEGTDTRPAGVAAR